MTLPPRSLRLPGETDQQFRRRAEHARDVARLLVTACLNNHDVQALISDPRFPVHAKDSFRRHQDQALGRRASYSAAGTR